MLIFCRVLYLSKVKYRIAFFGGPVFIYIVCWPAVIVNDIPDRKIRGPEGYRPAVSDRPQRTAAAAAVQIRLICHRVVSTHIVSV